MTKMSDLAVGFAGVVVLTLIAVEVVRRSSWPLRCNVFVEVEPNAIRIDEGRSFM